MANVPISNFTVPANTVGIGATGYSLTGSASASFIDLAGTWNTSGTPTAIKVNINNADAGSAAGSLLLDLQVGGSSRGRLSKAGALTVSGDITFNSLTLQSFGSGVTLGIGSGIGSKIQLGATRELSWSSGNVGGSEDLFLTRRAAANLRLGAADTTGTTAPTPQFLSAQSWASSTNNNQPGATFTIDGSQGTGTGAGGSIVFRVAPAGGTANGVQNALADALTIGSDRYVTTPRGYQFSSTTGIGNGNEIAVSNSVYVLSNGASVVGFRDSIMLIRSATTLGWATSTIDGSADTILAREAAGVTGVRGASASTGGALGFIEQTAPAAPATNGVRIYAEDNGAGKTRLMALFATGVAQQIAIEP